MWTTIPELAKKAHKDPDRLRQMARRRDDPLPLRFLPGDDRYGVVLESEMDEWVRRNGRLYNEKEG